MKITPSIRSRCADVAIQRRTPASPDAEPSADTSTTVRVEARPCSTRASSSSAVVSAADPAVSGTSCASRAAITTTCRSDLPGLMPTTLTSFVPSSSVQLSTCVPKRSPVSVRRTLTGLRFGTQVDNWTDDDGTKLVNVVGIKPGKSERQVVVIAARDAHDVPDTAGSAADTTALLELARVLQGRASTRTVVLVSADGSASARRACGAGSQRRRSGT